MHYRTNERSSIHNTVKNTSEHCSLTPAILVNIRELILEIGPIELAEIVINEA